MGNALLIRKSGTFYNVSTYRDLLAKGNTQTDILDVGRTDTVCNVIVSGTSKVNSNYYAYTSINGSNDATNWTQLDSLKRNSTSALIYRNGFTGYRYYRVYLEATGDNTNVPFLTAYMFALIGN